MLYLIRVTLKRFARAARNLVLILLLSFGLGEVALRLVNRVNPSYVFYDATYSRFRAQPGSTYYGFPINSDGFHDDEFSKDKAGAYRILALGDSFAFGIVPFEHNYLTLVQESLSLPDRPVEVLNMGIPRTGPMDYLALLVNEGLDFDPDMVMVSFYIGNDLIETYRAMHKGRRVHTRSYVLSLLRFALVVRPQTEAGVLRNRKAFDETKPTFDRKSHLEILGQRAKIYLVGWEGFAVAVAESMAAIEEISRICSARGIVLTVFLLPEETQLYPQLQRDLSATFKIYREGTMDYLQPNRAITERLEEMEVDCFDLYPAFQRAARSETLYKPRDTHWNIAGNHLAAERIADHLRPSIAADQAPR